MTICFRCQNGGQPTNSVNIITPHAHLHLSFVNYVKETIIILVNRIRLNRLYLELNVMTDEHTYQLLLNIRAIFPTCYILVSLVLNSRVFHTGL